MADRLVAVRTLQGVHRLRELGVYVPATRGVYLGLQFAHLGHQGVDVRTGIAHLVANLVESLDLSEGLAEGHTYVLAHGPILVEGRLLLEHPHAVTGREARLPVGDVLHASHNLEEGRLSHAVRPHDTDLRPREESHRDVIEDDLAPGRLADSLHLVDELCHMRSLRAHVRTDGSMPAS